MASQMLPGWYGGGSLRAHDVRCFELCLSGWLRQVYQPPPSDMLGNFKMPVFAAAMVLVMGYQFVKQRGPEGGEAACLNCNIW